MAKLNRFYIIGTIVSKPKRKEIMVGNTNLPLITFELEEKRGVGAGSTCTHLIELVGNCTKELYEGDNIGSEVICFGNVISKKVRQRYEVSLRATRLIYNIHREME